MLDAVTATVTRHKSLRAQLAATLSVHERHVRLLTRAVPEEARPSATGSATSSATPSATASAPAAPSGSTGAGATGPDGASAAGSPSAAASQSEGPEDRVPRDPGHAVRRLARQEDRLSLANKRASFAAGSGAFARLLASMAAAAAQQSVVLGGDAGSGRGRR